MITNNPFAELSATIPEFAMQAYVVAMFVLVIGGTVLDMIHKKSAQYFFENSKKAQAQAKSTITGGDKAAIAAKVLTSEVLTSSEFANPVRRMSHILIMYGFILFVATTAILIFGYATPEAAAPALVSALWHIGAIMLCVGGYWFWFGIRVDVYSEAVTYFKLVRADLFIVSLLTTCTFALIWSATQGSTLGWLFFVLFVMSSTVLFGGVLWSKFAHMFFKPAAAFQKRVTRADGSRENLPADFDLTDPAVQKEFPDIPEYMGKKPVNMGLGIKRESPNHY